MTNAFSIKEAVVFGWHKVKSHSGLVFGVMLTLFGLQVASSIVQKVLANSALGIAASIVLTVLGIILGAGMTLIVLKLAKGEHAQYRDIVPDLTLVWKYFCVSVLTGVIVFLPLMAGGLVALVLLVSTGSVNFSEGATTVGHVWEFALAVLIGAAAIICALYLGLRYSMARFAVLEGAAIVESLRKSARFTHAIKWHLVLFVLAIVALNIVGFIVLLVGLLVTIPVSVLAYAHIYLKLKAHHGHH
ncbi:MAG TPA: DUF975 family protein [Candidatus Paceibacterota bacterium]|nr:DUF975 family protein [Candidatus Paceibacterota bacterium]